MKLVAERIRNRIKNVMYNFFMSGPYPYPDSPLCREIQGAVEWHDLHLALTVKKQSFREIRP